MKIYIDGKFYDKEDAKISVFDHGFLYGDGVFEGIRAYNGKIFRADEHIDRIFASAQYIKLQIPMTKDEIREALYKTLEANTLKDAYMRLVISRGVGDLGLDPRKCPKPTVIIIATYWEAMYGDLYSKGIKVITASMRRIPPQCLDVKAKTLNYLNNILAKIETYNVQADEALMLDVDGFVSEGTGDNIFVVKGGKILTPSTDSSMLLGVTRKTVMDIAKNLNIEVEERKLTLLEIYNADETFMTGTAAEIIPIREVDGRKIKNGPGEITMKIMDEFKKII
ncbi:MAG: branched-chain-amino-acid transaminase [Candidatus Altiarchaeum hamiconexum]|uniref:Branched-chain-amino-acid aminotransferase n=1 Tax=Candidatus Altarchaeum hamiconexum TaxID=1803513 RepID=A0A8J7Z2H5_9ARCH|nr:branched-chain-amino-acid transaminase [Candidatus Altarchaeum hamiconexum]OIQ04877.1 MAG: branched-chain-amino-acid transaminase [Candidatus Altarchaeum sp. CG2_30_32_3053]PIN67269.1 MAG: branched-chain amino acid aminotransferase [Candidatus Altarchaeum sp. CG12_big_fil_rev_8_21_14_0_65_33_22]PIX48773.1 MAG: branched-chain amino acid aminotransferase [Candidatus Altarchaeum sp. CG_4_8_14_3_um_filter_33_2054]PIZ29612.1 MAG: branched-chain amino acid aminotransferase [Candidatus Altarchaeum 